MKLLLVLALAALPCVVLLLLAYVLVIILAHYAAADREMGKELEG